MKVGVRRNRIDEVEQSILLGSQPWCSRVTLRTLDVPVDVEPAQSAIGGTVADREHQEWVFPIALIVVAVKCERLVEERCDTR
jgi:hypothetical protein